MAEAVSGLTGSLQGTVTGLANRGQSFIDSIIPPETRNKILAWISKFAAEKPKLASFIASHIALSGLPLGLFAVMTISIAVFAVLAALILALLAAVIFIVLCVGFALVFLLPTLFITTGIATFLWLWGLGTYYILKWFNEKPIPGIHVPLKEGLEGEAGDYADRGVVEGYGQGMLPQGLFGQKSEGGEGGGIEAGDDQPGQEQNGGAKEEAGEGKGEKEGVRKRNAGGKENGKAHPPKLDASKMNGAGDAAGQVTGTAKKGADLGGHAGKVTGATKGLTG
ncbi:MAG: hypothetical protein OHK93_002795 [Ramalina farinacea]|uniref:Uncharacterized protein n=1 Tax=Ramalina farinacea TaxID=258253 RepID=A0AA43QS19_9LECA|nr:hypothetical protein [Ramalina farinacea]